MAKRHPDLPPGPRSKLQILRYLRDPYGFTEQMARRYGSAFTLDSPNGMAVITTTPDAAREILAGGEDDFYVGFGVEAIGTLIGSGSLLLLSGDRHRAERRVLSPTFHGRRMRAYRPLVLDATRREVAGWQAGTRIDSQSAMQSITLDLILRAVFGVAAFERTVLFKDTIRQAIDELNPLFLFFKFLQHELGGIGPWARVKRHQREFDRLIFEQIGEARRADEPGEDVLSRLVATRYDDGSPLPDQVIRDHLVTFLIAGHETTATALAWAMATLARHPEVVGRMRDEIAALGPDPSPDALAALPYLDAVSHEVLRLHPIIAEFFRTVKKGPFTLQGYSIPSDTSVAGSILMIHRDQQLYPEPEQFRPERFVERSFAPHEFAAFGGGHRHCIGAAFAMNEMNLVLASLVSRFDWSLELDHPPRIERRHVTLAPERGAPIRIDRVLAD
jgi:cytochrome P450